MSGEIKHIRYAEFIKLKDESGRYEEPADPETGERGLSWESPLDYYASKLGACGCGSPEIHVRYVRDALRAVANAPDFTDRVYESYAKWLGKLNEWRSDMAEVFRNDNRAEQFMWYWLDRNGYTEHGSCVPGWLTDSGKATLEDLTAVLDGIEAGHE